MEFWRVFRVRATQEYEVSYIDEHLNSGETVLYRTRLHWVVMIKHIVAALVLAGLSFGCFFWSFSTLHHKNSISGPLTSVGFLMLVAAAAIVLVAFSKRSATEMAVTNKRVVVKVGILSRRSREIFLSKIESVNVDQSFAGRIFSFGTIVLRGVGGTPESFPNIAHPLEFWNKVQEQIQRAQEVRTAMVTN